MCRICGSKNETYHLSYWALEWLTRFFRTCYHLINRRAYHKYLANKSLDAFVKEVEIFNRYMR